MPAAIVRPASSIDRPGTIRDRGHRLQAPGHRHRRRRAGRLRRARRDGAADSGRHRARRRPRPRSATSPASTCVLRGDVAVSLFPTGSITLRQRDARRRRQSGARGRPADARGCGSSRCSPAASRSPTCRWCGRASTSRSIATAARTGRRLIDALARALGPKANRPADATSFSEIRITTAPSRCDDAARGINETLQQRRAGAGLAVDLQELRRHRPLRLAQRAGRCHDHADAISPPRSPATAPGLKVRLTGAPLKVAFEGNWSTRPTLKVEGTLAADAAVAARHAALGRPQAADRRRLRPLRAQGQDQRLRRHDRALHRQRRARRQRRRGRLTFATDGRQTAAGHARRRRARSDALYLRRPPAHRQRARLEPECRSSLDGLNGVDLDLRLSAARITHRAAPSSAAPRSPPTCAAASST